MNLKVWLVPWPSFQQELNARATGEISVRNALNELDAWEIDAKFQLAEHKDSKDQSVSIVQDFKPVLNKVLNNLSDIRKAACM